MDICAATSKDVLSISELSVHRTELFPELDRSEFKRPKARWLYYE